MSWSGLPIRRLFPFTPWGLSLLAVGTGVLLLGVIRVELAALIWGSAAVLLVLYALAGAHLSSGLLRRHLDRRVEVLDLRLPVRRLFPGGRAEAEVAANMPRLALPGFQLWFAASLCFHERPPLRLACPLSPGEGSCTLAFRAPPRGLYRTHSAELVVRDVLGFTRAETLVPLSEQLRVSPAATAAEARIPHGNGGDLSLLRRDRRPSAELLEVRKYYPGDDPRRVHWKLFAHVQELFLRVGEQTPPPESRFLSILDLSPSPWIPPSIGPELLDGLIRACLSGLLGLLGQGYQAQLAVTDRSNLVSAAPERTDGLLSLCAELWWSEHLGLHLPRSGAREVFLYSLPGSRLQGEVLKACAGRRWGVRLFLPDLPEGAAGPAFLHRLFLREAQPRARGASLGGSARRRDRELRRRYGEALEEAAGRLTSATRSVHVVRA